MAERPSQKALSDFISEAQENIDALGADLLRLDRGGGDPDPAVLNAVFRAAHSLKGVSSMFGVDRMAKLAHALEDQLDDVRMGRRALDRPELDLLLEAPEVFSRIIAEEAAGGSPASSEAAEGLTARLRAKAAPPATPGPPAGGAVASLDLDPAMRTVLTDYEEHRLRTSLDKGLSIFRVQVAFDLATFDTDLAALNVRLKPLGEVVSTLPSPEVSDPTILAFDVLFASREAVEAIRAAAGAAARVLPVARGGMAPAAPAAIEGVALGASEAAEPEASIRSVSQAVRVDIRKLDRLMNVVGELVLIRTHLARLAERMRAGEEGSAIAGELQNDQRALERKLNELQAGILEVRMVPLGQVFDKLSRMVRKIARELGKEIDFRISGGDVELDKLIVEDLSDPLMHLIRNAIDHGIEPPGVRERAGKARAGRVALSAAQKGNHVEIVVEDDGAGIDASRVREVAVERGLATPAIVADMSHRELMNLIFVAGFSTARQVTSFSGRGVGMDVVKNNIANLSGIIDLQSDEGRGTRFEITLPVTLAIIRALVVEVAGRTYAVPLNSVLEILSPEAREVRTVSGREVITVRGTTLPLVRLSRFLGLAGGPPSAAAARLFVVVVGLAQERLGLVVDEVSGQQDILVKPLGHALQAVRGIAGATDLGSRRTVLVLDVGAIIQEAVTGETLRQATG